MWGWTFAAFTALVAFMRRSGWSFFVAFRVFVAFTGRWGWTFVAFMRPSRWSSFFWWGLGGGAFRVFVGLLGDWVGTLWRLQR